MKKMKLFLVLMFLHALTTQPMETNDIVVKFARHWQDYPQCKDVFLGRLGQEIMGDCYKQCIWMTTQKPYYLEEGLIIKACLEPNFKKKVLQALCEITCNRCKEIQKLLER